MGIFTYPSSLAAGWLGSSLLENSELSKLANLCKTNKGYILGEKSFGTFYAGQGMVALNNIVNQRPELLETIKILDDTKKLYTLTEFMDILSKLKVIT